MKFIFALLSLIVVARAAKMELEYQTQWEAYKTEHKKAYETPMEELARYHIWKNHFEIVNQHNMFADKGVYTYWLSMNKYADLHNQEFVAIYNGYNATMKMNTNSKPIGVFNYNPNLQVPDKIDWRDQGYVTPIKDQGQCGSCWAFSAVGSLEGQHFKAAGKLVSLSEQNLVDCSRNYGNQGCNGGLMDQAFSYIKDNKGIDTETSYPYHAIDQTCQFKPDSVGATDTGFVDVQSKSEDSLKQAVGTVGPVSVAIDASHTSFQLYSHGIYHEPFCSSTRLDHGVLAVGYDSDGAGKDYWIVKNSWGTGWGDKGYIKMARNQRNNCGIATAASYPTV